MNAGEADSFIKEYMHGGTAETDVPVTYDFSVSLHPLGMPGSVREYLRGRTDEGETGPAGRLMDDARSYPDRACRKLRAALAERYGLSAEQILCGNGASALLLAAAQALRPKTAFVTAPSFSGYAYALHAAGAKIREIPLPEKTGYSLNRSLIARESLRTGRMRDKETLSGKNRLLILCSPNNPVGNTVPEDVLEEALRFCEEENSFFLVDECFLPFVGNGEERSLIRRMQGHPNLLVLRAFTKEYAMPGLRLGWLASSNGELLRRIAGQMPEWSVAGIAQGAGLAALKEPDHAKRAWRMLAEERRYLFGELAKEGCTVYPSEANFLLFKAVPGLKERLLPSGILIRSCADFSGLTNAHYRIAVRTRPENEALIRAIRNL